MAYSRFKLGQINDLSINRRFRPRNSDSLETRLLSKRGFTDSGCWIWLGCCSLQGYGLMTVNGVPHNVSRVSAHVYLKLDLNNKLQFACHKNDICKRKDCFNPDHLYVGTRTSNSQDEVRLITHCPYGHEFTLENTRIHKNTKYCRLCSKLRHREERAGLKIGSLR